ncbi:MAG: hypothetical protein ACK4J0_00225 [Candidatus Anstonellaceae archaeon]
MVELLTQYFYVGTALSSLIVALTYMIGSLFSSEPLKGWARKEIADLLFIVPLFYILVFFLSNFSSDDQINIVSNSFGPESFFYKDLTNFSTQLITNVFYFSAVSSYNYNYQVGLSVSDLVPISIPQWFNFGGGLSSSQYPGYGSNIILNQLFFGIDYCFNILFLLNSIFLIFSFLVLISINFLLPLGIFLRVFPFTKKAGGFIVGYCLAVLFVFPFAAQLSAGLSSLVLEKAKKDGFISSIPNLEYSDRPPIKNLNAELIRNYILSPFYIIPTSVIANAIASLLAFIGVPPGFSIDNFFQLLVSASTPIAQIIQYIINLVKKIIPIAIGGTYPKYAKSTADIIKSYYKPIVTNILPTLSLYFLVILLSVIFQLTLTIVLGRNLSNFFGQEGQLYALYKIL